MSDNELDNLFKEAAADFESPQDPTAWKQMSARLDQQFPQPSGFWNWKRIASFTLAGLLVGSGVWYAVTPGKKLIEITENSAVANTIQNSIPQADDKNIGAVPSVKEESAVERSSISNKSNVETSQAGNDQSIPIPRSFTQTNHQQTVKQDKMLIQTDAKTETSANTNVDYPIEQTPVGLNNSSESRSNQVPNTVYNESGAAELAVLKTDSVVNPVMLSDPLVESEKSEIKNDARTKSKGGSGISVKLAISPDYSSINFSSSDKSGINYGALVGYTFNNRWSVYTGVISSKKLYSSTEIESSYSSGGNSYPVEKLDGDCRILDIPINVYYNFFPERSLSLKAGVGFSSYLMLNETYVYCVDYYGTDTYYEQNVKGKNNEWFKVLNLSITAEKRLTNRLSAEVEPFVKVPLAGVGEGKVSLVSLGAFVNVKFNLFKTQ